MAKRRALVNVAGSLQELPAADVLDIALGMVSAATIFTAGTNAQGQGLITTDLTVVVTTAASPSGVTLPSITGIAGSLPVIVFNRGSNPVNVYPGGAGGNNIDGYGTNLPISLPVGAGMVFWLNGTTWIPLLLTVANPVALGTMFFQQPTHTSLAVASTLTIAQLLTGIIQYTGAAATLTMPTGTLIEGGLPGHALAVDRAFEFTVINTGTGIATLAVGTGITLVGSGAVATASSQTFRLRRTVTNAYTLYRC